MFATGLLATAQMYAAQWVATMGDGGDGDALLLLAGPIGGSVIYFMLYRYYRNTDKSHAFEHDTIIESQPVTGGDVKVEEVRGTTRQRISGSNETSHRQRVQ